MVDNVESQKPDLKTLVDDSPDLIARFDRGLRYLYVNKTAEKIIGIPFASLIGKTNKELNLPESLEQYWSKNIEQVFKNGKESIIQLNFENQSLGKRYFQTRIIPEISTTGETTHVTTVAYDITELKDYEDVLKKRTEELQEAQARDEAILENIGDGLIVIDIQGKIVVMNNAAQTLLGWDITDAAGRLIVDVVSIENDKQPIASADRPSALALTKGKKTSATYYYSRRDKTKFPAAVVVTPLIVAGKIVGSIEVFRDITHEKVIDTMKTELISLTSHELRTPLSAMRGFISMIRNGDYGPTSAELQRPLEMVSKSTDRLIHIVNEMLDVSRIEAGKLMFQLSEQNMLSILTEVITNIKPLAEEKKLQLVVTESLELLVQTDKEKTIEILDNLIGNSIKFTEKGEISFTVAQKGDLVIVFITDTGIGIANEDQNKLFGKFDEIKLKQAGKTAGTGLGLYISNEFAKRLGGGVWIERSKPGSGSTFAFSLPLANSKLAQKVKAELEGEVNNQEK